MVMGKTLIIGILQKVITMLAYEVAEQVVLHLTEFLARHPESEITEKEAIVIREALNG